jgi:hypothetical protein
MKPFGATNQPRTCLWCGAKLRSLDSPRTLAKRIERARKYRNVNQDAAEAEVRRLHEKWKDHYGKHDGLFCTDACAIAFGCEAARYGYRFEPRAAVPPGSGKPPDQLFREARERFAPKGGGE